MLAQHGEFTYMFSMQVKSRMVMNGHSIHDHLNHHLHVVTVFVGHPMSRQGEKWHMSEALIRNLQEHNTRAAVLAQHGAALLPALFALVQRLEEVESKVRVLQLVSVSIEALGDAAGPLLGSVAGALPMVSVSCLL